MKKLFTVLLLILAGLSFAQTTLEQQLSVVRNDGVNGGQFNVAVQVKGTNLTAANTLGSATIDVTFDNTQLTFVSGTGWAFGAADGYSRAATNNTTFIRVGLTGGAVGPSNGTVGYDIGSTYTTWVQLNFTIVNAAANVSFGIAAGSNAIGLFANHANNPENGVINNQTLSTPIVISNQPLPVELTSFTAATTEAANVELKWKTATEVNNYGFDIERKLSSSNTWQKITFVAGSGNSSSPKDYSFLDKSLKGGSKFDYRLKQIDITGGFKYSEVNSVTIIPKVYSLSQNYPNPFNPSTKIDYTLPEASKVTIQIYNSIGQLVKTIQNENQDAGFYTISFDASRLSSGVYLYRIIANHFSSVKKMLLLK